jgi:iron complex transport system ATP-binding protein
MDTLIQASSLSFKAGRVTLVDDVAISAAPGELVAIIGPNGAGKSTLLRLLAGDVHPSAGSIRIGTEELDTVDEGVLAQRRAVLPQNRVADVPFTAYEVVAMGRHPHRRDPDNSRAADEAAIAAAMASTATREFADRVYATLSGGEQARVTLARILAQEAPILLLDEPTTALDIAHEERVMQELIDRATAGAAVLAVLHDLNAAARYATRIVAMAAGRVRASGSPAEVLTEDLLTSIYGQPMRVVPHPFRDCPLVLVAD